MKFLLKYQQPKKKKSHYSVQTATFFDIRDAMLFERFVVENKGAINSEIRPL